MDLFRGGPADARGGAPVWLDLPKDAQDALVGLMMQLILEHARTSTGRSGRWRPAMIAEKICPPASSERKAILYVRQSSAHQVLHNCESSALQYAMRDRLAGLGWSGDRDHRRGSRLFGRRRRAACRLRSDGG